MAQYTDRKFGGLPCYPFCMNRVRAAFSIAFLAAGVAAFASPQSIIAKKKQEYRDSIKKKDVSWFKANTTDDYVEVGKTKTLTKAQALAQINLLAMYTQTFQTIDTKVLSFTMQGKNAIVVTQSHLVATLKGAKGKPSLLEHSDKATELWVPSGSTYKLKKTTDIFDKTTINGKPYGAQ